VKKAREIGAQAATQHLNMLQLPCRASVWDLRIGKCETLLDYSVISMRTNMGFLWGRIWRLAEISSSWSLLHVTDPQKNMPPNVISPTPNAAGRQTFHRNGRVAGLRFEQLNKY